MAIPSWVWVVALMLVFHDIVVTAGVPLILALVAAAVIEPFVRLLDRHTPLSRGFSVFIVLLLGLLVGIALLTFGTALVVMQASDVVQRLPEYRETIVALSEHWLDVANHWIGRIPPGVVKVAKDNVQHISSAAESVVFSLGQSLFNFAGTIPNLIAILFVSLIATFFLSKDRVIIVSSLLALLSEKRREQVEAVRARITDDVFGFVRAQLTLISLTTIVTSIGLLLIAVPNWFLVSLIAGSLDLLPVLGPGMIFVPWSIYLIATGSTALGIKILVLYAVTSTIRQLFEAKVIGDSIGVHPLVTLLALYVGLSVLGLKGLIVAPLAVILGKALWEAGVIHLGSRPTS